MATAMSDVQSHLKLHSTAAGDKFYYVMHVNNFPRVTTLCPKK